MSDVAGQKADRGDQQRHSDKNHFKSFIGKKRDAEYGKKRGSDWH